MNPVEVYSPMNPETRSADPAGNRTADRGDSAHRMTDGRSVGPLNPPANFAFTRSIRHELSAIRHSPPVANAVPDPSEPRSNRTDRRRRDGFLGLMAYGL